MTRKDNTKKKFEFRGFINLEFSPDERNQIIAHSDTFNTTMSDNVAVLVEADYKVGFSHDDYHNVKQISATCKDPGSRYFGYCFTMRHSDLDRAAGAMRYYYDFYLREELYQIETNNKQFDW